MDNEENSARDGYTDRRFRRYHKAQARRKKAAAADERFSRAVFSVAGVAAAIAIALGVVTMNGANMDAGSVSHLTDPWIGPMSRLEAAGLGFIAFLAAVYLWRIRKR